MMDGDKALNHTPTNETPSKVESDAEEESADADVQHNRFSRYFARYKWVVTYVLVVLVMTGYVTRAYCQHRANTLEVGGSLD